MAEIGWQFIQVDPLAPKKRRQRRRRETGPSKKVKLQIGGDLGLAEYITDREYGAYTPAEEDVSSIASANSHRGNRYNENIDVEQGQERASGEELPSVKDQTEDVDYSQLDDFDRFCLYSGGSQCSLPTASTTWCSLEVNVFLMWTPLANSIIENSLFHYWATESVTASVSFDGVNNLFRSALLPLVSTEPILFHGAIAVASIHWANKLTGVKRSLGVLDARSEEQLKILRLSSKYHRRVALDLKRSSEGNSARNVDQKIAETRAAALILFDTWRTFSDGIATRETTLAEAASVVRQYCSSPITPVGRFLRMMTSWLDPLDAMAHKRPSTSLAEIVDMSERDVIDSAVRLTSGCEAETLRLISEITVLSTTDPEPTTWLAAQVRSACTTDLQTRIMARVGSEHGPSEQDLSTYAFNLALVLYFHSQVLLSSLEHPLVRWAVQGLLNVIGRAQLVGYRQAWATWPYFMLGVHVSAKRDRQIVQDRFRWMEETISIGNLFALREVLTELWKRRDRGEMVDWQQVSLDVRGGIVSPL